MSRFGKSTEVRAAGLVGALVRNRSLLLPQGAELFHRLRRLIRQLNHRYEEQLLLPLTLSEGDELLGVVETPELGLQLARDCTEVISPARLVFGLGWGKVKTGGPFGSGTGWGPGLDLAHQALAAARDSGTSMEVRGFGPEVEEAAGALLRLLDQIRSGWTEKQARYVAAARRASQKEVAARFRVSPSTVSESLQAAAFPSVLRAERAAAALLAAVVREEDRRLS